MTTETAEMKAAKLTVDLDTPAADLEGYRTEHAPGGKHAWQPEKFVCLASHKQRVGSITVKELLEELESHDAPVCNANMLNFLIEHQCIPAGLEKFRIIFPNTRYLKIPPDNLGLLKYTRTAYATQIFYSGTRWRMHFIPMNHKLDETHCIAAFPVRANLVKRPILFIDDAPPHFQ